MAVTLTERLAPSLPQARPLMEKFVIDGGAPLSGTVVPAGNKNGALPILAASVLTTDGTLAAPGVLLATLAAVLVAPRRSLMACLLAGLAGYGVALALSL